MKKLIIITLLFISLSPTRSFAWGKEGHALVAEVAWSMLDDNTQENVKKVLGTMTIEQASVWLDEIKNDHRFDYTKAWHYVNVEEGKTYEPGKEGDIINQLSRAINELQHKDKLKEEDLKMDLMMVFHLTGDLHQPLHVGYGSDKGGNTVQLQHDGHGTNLHRVWDSEIIKSEDIRLKDCLALLKTFTKKDIDNLFVINVEEWMKQPRSQLKTVYDFKDGTIDNAYTSKNKDIVEQEIVIAGIRLAAILKDVFKS